MNALGNLSQLWMLDSKNGEISGDIFDVIDHNQMEMTCKNTLLNKIKVRTPYVPTIGNSYQVVKMCQTLFQAFYAY